MMRPVPGREPAGYRGPTVVLTPAAARLPAPIMAASVYHEDHNGDFVRPVLEAVKWPGPVSSDLVHCGLFTAVGGLCPVCL